MSVELPTVLLMGPGALLCLHLVWHRSPARHLAIFAVSLVELIGGWYTFGPEWVRLIFHPNTAVALSSANTDPWLFWILLVFMNGLWVIVPGIIAVDAAVRLLRASDGAEGGARGGARVPPPFSGRAAYRLIALLLLAYAILIPVALGLAKPSSPQLSSK